MESSNHWARYDWLDGILVSARLSSSRTSSRGRCHFDASWLRWLLIKVSALGLHHSPRPRWPCPSNKKKKHTLLTVHYIASATPNCKVYFSPVPPHPHSYSKGFFSVWICCLLCFIFYFSFLFWCFLFYLVPCSVCLICYPVNSGFRHTVAQICSFIFSFMSHFNCLQLFDFTFSLFYCSVKHLVTFDIHFVLNELNRYGLTNICPWN